MSCMNNAQACQFPLYGEDSTENCRSRLHHVTTVPVMTNFGYDSTILFIITSSSSILLSQAFLTIWTDISGQKLPQVLENGPRIIVLQAGSLLDRCPSSDLRSAVIKKPDVLKGVHRVYECSSYIERLNFKTFSLLRGMIIQTIFVLLTGLQFDAVGPIHL